MHLQNIGKRAKALAVNIENLQYTLENTMAAQSSAWKDTPVADVCRELVDLVETAVINLGEVDRLAMIHHQP